MKKVKKNICDSCIYLGSTRTSVAVFPLCKKGVWRIIKITHSFNMPRQHISGEKPTQCEYYKERLMF